MRAPGALQLFGIRRENQKKASPAIGLSPSFANATAGIMNMRKGVRSRKMKNIARDMGKKYMVVPLLILYQLIS